MKKQKIQKEVTLTGYIVPEEWDMNDNVIAIGLITEEDDYLIELNKIGEELFDFLDEDLEVTGTVREDKDGTKHITITGYEILRDEDSEDEEGYDDYDYEDEDYEEGDMDLDDKHYH